MKTLTPPPASRPGAAGREKAEITIRGAVQGVGFRPFVFRLARELGLSGRVRNSPAGVAIEAEGPRTALDQFLARLETDKPPCAEIRACAVSFGACAGLGEFAIGESDRGGPATAAILPDLAPCPECRREIFTRSDRRHRYPFTNCTHCGPRFSLIEALPYDRENTAMRRFRMCPACAAEYDDPASRRFHAQPNACPRCGPQLALWDAAGGTLARGDEALRAAVARLREGAIVALKGVGGFQFLVDARSAAAVGLLRERKRRAEKPFAVMFPDLAAVRAACAVSAAEAALLASAAAPIVLLERRPGAGVAPGVAPGNPRLGAMLPSSPLHELLLADAGFPLVATSGNRSDEPICTDEAEALVRLGGLADYFLVHDRPIVRPVDDSVARILLGRPQVLRRARGYAPLPVGGPEDVPPILAVGPQMKCTVALGVGGEVFLSQHLGDLDSPQARAAFARAAADLPRLYGAAPGLVACDLHPGYVSTAWARETGREVVPVQHHHAHVLAAMAEHGLTGAAFGICWDGTGYGTDGTIWGGEFLRVDETGFERMARFRPFLLAGGDAAAREPRRSALGVLHALWGDAAWEREELPPVRAFSAVERRVLARAFARGCQTVATSSAGRLFDAVASLAGLRQVSNFEGQAAMDLEFAIERGDHAPYPFALRAAGPLTEFDWGPMISAIADDAAYRVPAARIAASFHGTLVSVAVALAVRAGMPEVVLTGGCFQNAWLAERTARALLAAGFRVHWPERVPPNDGGVALGQVTAAARAVRSRRDAAQERVA